VRTVRHRSKCEVTAGLRHVRVHDAGRRGQADDERAVERGRHGVGDDPADRDRMSGSADDPVTVSVATSALPSDIVGPTGYVR
jgi:hypothetical protein